MVFPKRCFVSHSYADQDRLQALSGVVPPDTELVIFPRREPNRRFPVSNAIVPKILACDGLIYLVGGKSEHSQWVAFEKDYARRLGKAVYAFNPDTRILSRDTVMPADLRIQVMLGPESEDRAEHLLKWMKEERGFALDLYNVGTVHSVKEVPIVFLDLCVNEKIALWLLDRTTVAILNLRDQTDPELFTELLEEMNDGEPVPPEAPYVFARVHPGWHRLTSNDAEERAIINEIYRSQYFIDLVRSDFMNRLLHSINKHWYRNELDWNRVDDLIVGLTMLCLHYPS